MNPHYILLFSYSIFILFTSCGYSGTEGKAPEAPSKTEQEKTNYLKDYPATNTDGTINAVIEIPAGTVEKWELNKADGKIELEHIDNAPRLINYLGYPGNYGMIPRTLLSKELGGDGDPLDIIVLGPPEERGSIIECKLIGILYLMDNGEQDDKLIAVSPNTSLYKVEDMGDLETKFSGITEILEIWFTNYKGSGQMTSKGFGNKESARKVLTAAINQYKRSAATAE